MRSLESRLHIPHLEEIKMFPITRGRRSEGGFRENHSANSK